MTAARRDFGLVQPDASCLSASNATRPPGPADASPGPGGTRRVCAWCGGPIPARARRDAVCCSKRCRQARHRFTTTVGRAAAAAGRPLRLAYADPPYPGNARLYRDHPDYAGEVDHAALIRRLGLYDGWALSTSAAALPAVLALCPPGVCVAAWHRGPRTTASWHPLHAWEPVIYRPGRPVDPSCLPAQRVDSLVCGVSAMTTLPGRVTGTKPATVCRWIFDLIGAAPGDSLDDLFPGSGAVTRAWLAFTGQPEASCLSASNTTRPPGPADASHPAAPDVSCLARADTSPQVLNDASPESGPAPGASRRPTTEGAVA